MTVALALSTLHEAPFRRSATPARLLEKYLQKPLQAKSMCFGDCRGGAIHLAGERDLAPSAPPSEGLE